MIISEQVISKYLVRFSLLLMFSHLSTPPRSSAARTASEPKAAKPGKKETWWICQNQYQSLFVLGGFGSFFYKATCCQMSVSCSAHFLSSLRFVSRAGSDLASVCWTLRKSVDVVEFAGVGYLRCKQLANLEWTQAHLCDSVSWKDLWNQDSLLRIIWVRCIAQFWWCLTFPNPFALTKDPGEASWNRCQFRGVWRNCSLWFVRVLPRQGRMEWEAFSCGILFGMQYWLFVKLCHRLYEFVGYFVSRGIYQLWQSWKTLDPPTLFRLNICCCQVCLKTWDP